jgi:flagellar protein FliO/FliZ
MTLKRCMAQASGCVLLAMISVSGLAVAQQAPEAMPSAAIGLPTVDAIAAQAPPPSVTGRVATIDDSPVAQTAVQEPATTIDAPPQSVQTTTPPPAPATPVAGISPIGQPADFSKTLLGLIAVLALMAGVAWMMRRFGVVKPSNRSVAKVVGGVSVGSRERVMVVEVAGQWIVVGVAPGRVSALAQFPKQEDAELATDQTTAPTNFSEWLKQTVQKRDGGGTLHNR